MSDSNNRRKVLAVLAGGLVLGVGAAVTLAAWNDSEFATGTFTAGAFNLEGATDGAGGTYSDHNVDEGDSAATLTFTTPLAGNLSPTDVVYAPFWVRLDDTTTSNAALVAASATGTGDNAENISYAVYSIGAAATCDATAVTGGTLVASGTDLTDFTAGSSVALAKGAAVGTAGAPAQLCFVATAGADLVEGEAATATWKFTATSN
ncbi:hypothetical protein GCM10025768_08220 [Microbacterium pseudoresistens]|uniref:Putative ribosomally synthesized peptide with SipW-like signal peptide n=1 Tax=Microbacterium pseudoresistens TaxID=640634 RepID=A0A7Y9EVD5_9MICO|nr:SipW-dependent-type signal peptide-containing protein [Microbacterium pseudoresistens]NYD54658.1 putative ribosomally synthesized peptide with SipW-like signal peptide [Microbacterium pseudoresistens]